jgi:N-acylglucosamine 2-epimerase
VWMLSKLHNCEGARPGYLEAAASGARFLREHGRDANGDWFLALDRQGEPIDGARDFFSGCFAALGLGEYSLASGEAWAAELAVQTFAQAEEAARTGRIPLNELAPEDSSLLSLSVPMILINLATELGEAVPGCEVTPTLRRALELVMTKFVDRSAGLVYERVSPDGSHPDTPDGRLITPGHGIEAMWFAMVAAERVQDRDTIDLAAEVLLCLLEAGWDEQYGGILTHLDAQSGQPSQPGADRKVWWPHCEALVALMLAWRLTRRTAFAEWYDRVHAYTWSHFPDPEWGEWYTCLNRQGEVADPRKGFGYKGCFHVPRALWWCLRTLREIEGEA